MQIGEIGRCHRKLLRVDCGTFCSSGWDPASWQFGITALPPFARVWASLETRDVVRSKMDSAAWALERLPREFQAIVEAAMRFYRRCPKPGDEQLTAGDFPMFIKEIRRRAGANA